MEYQRPLPYDQLPEHLRYDVVHVWRASTGIELIHREASIQELNRIWANWQLMSERDKTISDRVSIELFGLTNEGHYLRLATRYLATEDTNGMDYGLATNNHQAPTRV